MRKKYNKQKRNVFWELVTVGGFLIILAIFLFAFQGGNERGTPAIIVDQEWINFGEVKYNTPLSFTIKVTNSGDGVLRFIEPPYIEVLEGC